MYVCVCNAITERQVRAAVDGGATTLDDLQFELGVATCCGTCAATAAEYLPGGRCSSVCQATSLTHPTAVAIADQTGPAANSFPIPIVKAA
ncbi:(2Fe-2S)-binding protein [Bordetella genomosp. 9]|uniref:Bacterioferritin-associated ferredoxin n=1 Tax=Bordetella genomosp. 9 TaxID=1416803 RepID=A0A1W6YUS5_9BORD|nr:(2Fe-2S)-binding protein [Bordetella genomosp. 9]ARP84845.1 bacterioferritin [Bordetella genomosp. 9]